MEYSGPLSLTVFGGNDPLLLESGSTLPEVNVEFETYGKLNADRSNAILVCHALTAGAHAAGLNEGDSQPGWWDPLIGPGRALNTRRYFVVCSNILGSCYGSTGPTSVNPWTGRPYGASFPAITVRDMVRVQKRLLEMLGVQRLACVTGSSLGGMQALEWGILYPNYCETMIPLSIAARQTAWCIALNSVARAAINLHPEHGLAAARMIGMISYRSPEEFENRFGRRKQHAFLSAYDAANVFEIESYLAHQGRKLADRFDADTYVCLSRAMDLHDVSERRGNLEDVLGSVRAATLCIGVSSDMRYPTVHQRELAEGIPGALYGEIDSIHGHDAFLIEFDQLGSMISGFLAEHASAGYRKVSGWR